MDHKIVFATLCGLFWIRDARLIATRPKLFRAYVPMLLATAVVCAWVAEYLSFDQVHGMFTDARLWALALAIHGFHMFRSGRMSRQGDAPEWWMFAPGPVLAAALIDIYHFGLARIDGSTGLTLALALSAIQAGTVGMIVRIGAVHADPIAALRFGAVSHFSALALLAALALPDRPIASQSVDWTAASLVLGSVGMLVGASILWHRLRQRQLERCVAERRDAGSERGAGARRS